MSTSRWHPPGWLAGRFDVTIATGLAVLVILTAVSRSDWNPVPLDLFACVAAALTTRWPRAAGAVLAVALILILFMPAGPSLGEYAAFIPILCAGMRGECRLRLEYTVVYGAILAVRSYTIAGGADLWLLVVLFWAALIGLLWGVGNLFANYRAALDRASAAALQQQRISLARELHDTVARDLVRASLQGQAALAAHPAPQLESALREIQQASTHLRWLLALLREPDAGAADATATTSTGRSLDQAAEALRRNGLLVRTFVEGDLNAIPAALLPTVQAVVGEACANMERHADPASPCAIMLNVGDDRLDAAFFNHVRADHSPGPNGFGLDGVRERLALVGGHLISEQEGGQWICRVSLPL